MPARLTLEQFDRGTHSATEPVPEIDLEELRLAAYEKGYSAGWDDAAKAQSDDQLHIREDLARNLRDLSFTYHEARTHLLRGLENLLRGMVDRILPEMARDTLGAAVVGEITTEAGRLSGAPVEVLVSPASRAAVEAALGACDSLPVRLAEEPTLADGQVRFRFGEEERALDQDALVASIRRLVTQFLDASTEERLAAHG